MNIDYFFYTCYYIINLIGKRGEALKIKYRNNQLQKICTNASVARREYGADMARKIHQRIDQIEAAETVEILLLGHIGRCHLLHGDRENQYAMDLVHPYRLIFTKQGERIQIAEIQEIVDYH